MQTSGGTTTTAPTNSASVPLSGLIASGAVPKSSASAMMSMEAIGQGLLGLANLKDPVANNLRQFVYLQLLRRQYSGRAEVVLSAGPVSPAHSSSSVVPAATALTSDGTAKEVAAPPSYGTPLDIVTVVRALKLNALPVPVSLEAAYAPIAANHAAAPAIELSRPDKLITQRYMYQFPAEKVAINTLFDGFQLDMLFPQLKLNIELDGPTHSYASRVRADRERDAYLSDKGYTVSFVWMAGSI